MIEDEIINLRATGANRSDILLCLPRESSLSIGLGSTISARNSPRPALLRVVRLSVTLTTIFSTCRTEPAVTRQMRNLLMKKFRSDFRKRRGYFAWKHFVGWPWIRHSCSPIFEVPRALDSCTNSEPTFAHLFVTSRVYPCHTDD